MPVDASLIRSVDWSPQVGEIGEVVVGAADVSQEITIVVITPKGSDPHRPTFGCDAWKYLDTPISEVGPDIIREVTEAVNTWVDRARVTRVEPLIEEQGVRVNIYWQSSVGGETGLTEVAIGQF